MNGPQAPSLDWSSVFSRARRRVAVQLAIAAAIGAAGAVLLFGGGTVAHHAVHAASTAPPPGESGDGPACPEGEAAESGEDEESPECAEDLPNLVVTLVSDTEVAVENQGAVSSEGFSLSVTGGSLLSSPEGGPLEAEGSQSFAIECEQGETVEAEVVTEAEEGSTEDNQGSHICGEEEDDGEGEGEGESGDGSQPGEGTGETDGEGGASGSSTGSNSTGPSAGGAKSESAGSPSGSE